MHLTGLLLLATRVQVLSLWCTDVPVAALHALTGLKELATLKLDLLHCDQLTTEELASVLCTLCYEIGGIVNLGVVTDSRLLDVEECEELVLEQVDQWYPAGFVQLEIEGPYSAWKGEGEDMAEETEEDEEGEDEAEDKEGQDEEGEEGMDEVGFGDSDFDVPYGWEDTMSGDDVMMYFA